MECKNCGSGTLMVTTMNRKVGNQQVKASYKCMKCENQWFEIQEMKVICRGHKPSYTNKYAAGLDLKSNTEVNIPAKETTMERIKRKINIFFGKEVELQSNIADIESRLSVEIPRGYFGMVVARSGLSFKRQIKLINDVGIIDEDYRGDIGIRLVNEGTKPYTIKAGDRVAQMITIPYIQPELIYVDELGETERGRRGFGSSGR